jgi:adenine C2-methylase RlmN of 23S rRNA A2503 and tRNA A37
MPPSSNNNKLDSTPTIKLLVKLQDDHLVEAVIMRYGGEGRKASNRATLCVSSQVGCKMGCTFCATGTMGLSGNLTSGEILEQLMHANRVLAPTGQRIRKFCRALITAARFQIIKKNHYNTLMYQLSQRFRRR